MTESLFDMIDCIVSEKCNEEGFLQNKKNYLSEMANLADLPTEQEFLCFQKLIHDQIGIHLPRRKRAMLGHRLHKRVRQLGCENFSQYFDYINEQNKTELEYALELITTNETFFFREQKHFDFLISDILPHYSYHKPLNIWCGASSTGEEPYSLAMTLEQHCNAPWSLLATDVNKAVINHAIKGIYLDERTANIPKQYKSKFCSKGIEEFDGYFRVNADLREKVLFRQFNLLENMQSLGQFDVVFLRNVMIYFKDETKQAIVEKIAQILKPDGFLIIGHAESLYGISNHYDLIKPSIYKRKSA